MSEAKFTDGPWIFSDDRDLEIIMNGNTEMCNEKYYPWCPSNKADWQLIAAAPELYEALETFLDMYVELAASGDAGNWNYDNDPEVIAARKALSKARGETNA